MHGRRDEDAEIPENLKPKEQLKGKLLKNALEDNLAMIMTEFKDVDVLKYRELSVSVNGQSKKFCFIFTEGLVSSEIIDGFIIKPLMAEHNPDGETGLIQYLMDRVIQVNGIEKTDSMSDIAGNLSYGDSLLLADGCAEGLLIDTKQFTTRSVSEPNGEIILSGPREGFTESIMQNLSMLRRKLRTCDLKLKFLDVGKKSGTMLCVAYMDSIVNKSILKELYSRLDKIDIDAVLDSNYIAELVRDNPLSVFRSTGYTERPDVVAGKLLEGRIAVFVDGSPVVMTLPYLFIENFQSNEDYYLSFYYTSFSRLLRMAGFLLSIIVPALYTAIVSFHQEMLPGPLMINVASDSHNVPFPAALEALLLLIMFDILRETGIRMPMSIGQALSIVGALVVGSAAVEADLVSAPMIIVTAISGITSLLVPKLNVPVILIRLALLLLSSFFGLYGLVLGTSAMFIHMLKLESFGVLQLSPDKPLSAQRLRDSFIRAPWWKMLPRPYRLTANRTRQRQQKGGKP